MSSGQFRPGALDGGEGVSAPEDSLGQYGLLVGAKRIPIHAGATLIGRDETCHVVLNGALVSRRHARVVLDSEGLSVEDLRSTNGTFLNGGKVHGLVPLHPGDRLFIGSFEIDIVRSEVKAPESGVTGGATFESAPPSSDVAIVARIVIARERGPLGPLTQAVPAPNPLELDTIESAGRLADRMFALGRPLAGRDILSDPLEQILAAARKGLAIDPSVVDSAGRSAMKLAQEMSEATWMNLALELHLLAGLAMKTETLEQLVALRKKSSTGDDELVARYHERIAAIVRFMPLAERLLYAELAGLDPNLDADE